LLKNKRVLLQKKENLTRSLIFDHFVVKIKVAKY